MRTQLCPKVSGSPSCVSSHAPLRFCLILSLIVLFFSTNSLVAEIPGLTWQEGEVVAAGVSEIPSFSGNAAAHTPWWSPWGDEREWHIVYENSGHVFRQIRTEEGWQPAEQVTESGAAARDPKLAFHGNLLHVVWEDERTGHPEVWSRAWDGNDWLDEECVTCDETPSAIPSVAGNDDDGFLVWQEGPDGSSQILGSYWEPGVGWGAPLSISESPESAFDPSVSTNSGGFLIVWADTRHLGSEIYLRMINVQGNLGDEIRVTDMDGSCRRPNAYRRYVGGDNLFPHTLISFENDQTGPPEVWVACCISETIVLTQQISPDDGIPSQRPNMAEFPYSFYFEDSGTSGGRWFVTWSDQPLLEPATHRIAFLGECDDPPDGEDAISYAGLSTSTLGAIGAYGSDTMGEILALWVEETDGVQGPALHSIRGNMLACLDVYTTAPRSAALGPEGFPADTITAWNYCGDGGPFEGEVVFDFSDVDSQLTWDVTQEHPIIGPVPVDPEGRAIFEIRGGGCATSGHVLARLSGITVATWQGAKSPDVDGDCVVTFEDLAYVTVNVGTDDFCADLDGSGLVDMADMAIAEAAYGHHCTQVSSVENPGGVLSNGLHLQVAPNPFVNETAIALKLPVAGEANLRIVDVGGRVVRDFGRMVLSNGRSIVNWDARDGSGRNVASGVYFVQLMSQGMSVQRSALILR